MSSFAGRLRPWFLVAAGFGLLIIVLACFAVMNWRRSVDVQPQARTTGASTKDGIYIHFLHWEDGGMLLLVDDVKGHHGWASGDSREGGWQKSGSVAAHDDTEQLVLIPSRGYKELWKFLMKDGKVTSFRIDGKEYDLSKGALFFIKAKGEQVEVHQRKRDLSTIRFDSEGCLEFLDKDAEVQKVFRAADVPK